MNAVFSVILNIVALTFMGVFATFLMFLYFIKRTIERENNVDKTKKQDI